MVDEVDVTAAWEGLTSGPRSQLVDVRTRAEWTYVGIPDLAPIGKRAVLVEWQTFPDQAVDARFVERLAGELKALGVQPADDLYFICRSGSRSLAAARALAQLIRSSLPSYVQAGARSERTVSMVMPSRSSRMLETPLARASNWMTARPSMVLPVKSEISRKS